MMNPLLILPIAFEFALADRLAGGDYIAHLQAWIARSVASWPSWAAFLVKAVANARSVLWASLALAVALALTGLATPFGPKLSVLAVSFAAWRWVGWTVFGGAIDPKTPAQVRGLLARHAVAVMAFAPALGWLTHWQLSSLFPELLGPGLFAAYATLLGIAFAKYERPGIDANAIVEVARGFGLGLTVAVILI